MPRVGFKARPVRHLPPLVLPTLVRRCGRAAKYSGPSQLGRGDRIQVTPEARIRRAIARTRELIEAARLLPVQGQPASGVLRAGRPEASPSLARMEGPKVSDQRQARARLPAAGWLWRPRSQSLLVPASSPVSAGPVAWPPGLESERQARQPLPPEPPQVRRHPASPPIQRLDWHRRKRPAEPPRSGL